MFDKKKCGECKYHTLFGHMGANINKNICCDYALKTGQTCLTKDGEDRRGNDPKHCKLYIKRDLLAERRKIDV